MNREFLDVVADGSAALCLFGDGTNSRRRNKGWQSVRMHYSVAIRTLSTGEKRHCTYLAVLYDIPALLNRALYGICRALDCGIAKVQCV